MYQLTIYFFIRFRIPDSLILNLFKLFNVMNCTKTILILVQLLYNTTIILLVRIVIFGAIFAKWTNFLHYLSDFDNTLYFGPLGDSRMLDSRKKFQSRKKICEYGYHYIFLPSQKSCEWVANFCEKKLEGIFVFLGVGVYSLKSRIQSVYWLPRS